MSPSQFDAKKTTENRSATASIPTRLYATRSDFCRAFAENTNGLYLLALLLTGRRELAEECFVSSMADAMATREVFRESTNSYARRAVMQCAIQLVKPGLDDENALRPNCNLFAAEYGRAFDAVCILRPFERFVFVMSVLERCADDECSVLLGQTKRDVIAARIRALQDLAAGLSERMAASLDANGTEQSRDQIGIFEPTSL